MNEDVELDQSIVVLPSIDALQQYQTDSTLERGRAIDLDVRRRTNTDSSPNGAGSSGVQAYRAATMKVDVSVANNYLDSNAHDATIVG
jgi:hypothetical protein